MAERPFIVVSGLPGSGKTTLAIGLAALLRLPLLDKDDILEAMFGRAGEVDVELRQRLSRMSDDVLARVAAASHGAVLVSFWRHADAGGVSGTPVAWLRGLGGTLVEVHCVCSPDVAERRFQARRRHPGHNDAARQAGRSAQFARLAALGPLGIGVTIPVRTDAAYDVVELVCELRRHIAGGA